MEKEGMKLFPPPPRPHRLSRTPTRMGFPPPHALTATWAALLSRLLCFRTRCLSLLAWLASRLTTSSGKVTPPPPWVAVHTPKTMHINTTNIRKGRN
jgi:hypothetical protein